jgi:hypothetical protein
MHSQVVTWIENGKIVQKKLEVILSKDTLELVKMIIALPVRCPSFPSRASREKQERKTRAVPKRP